MIFFWPMVDSNLLPVHIMSTGMLWLGYTTDENTRAGFRITNYIIYMVLKIDFGG